MIFSKASWACVHKGIMNMIKNRRFLENNVRPGAFIALPLNKGELEGVKYLLSGRFVNRPRDRSLPRGGAPEHDFPQPFPPEADKELLSFSL